jgi:hypothetical protein
LWLFFVSEKTFGKIEYQDAAAWFFRIDLSDGTVSNYAKDAKLSYKLCGSRFRPVGLDFATYCQQYYQWVLDRHNDGSFARGPSLICCMDFLTTSERVERIKSYQPKGGKQWKISGKASKYTDTIFLCVFADGEWRVLPRLFTHNPDLDLNGPNGALVMAWLKKEGLPVLCVVYVYKKDATFCAECKDQVHTALSGHDFGGVLGIRDKGPSYGKKNEDIFADYGFERVVVLDPDTHGELSVLDNPLNAIIKAEQRSCKKPGMADWEKSLLMLRAAYNLKKKTIVDAFEKNYFLGKKKLSLAKVEEMLKGKRYSNPERDAYHDSCIKQYEAFAAQNPLLCKGPLQVGNDCDLNGWYWSRPK